MSWNKTAVEKRCSISMSQGLLWHAVHRSSSWTDWP